MDLTPLSTTYGDTDAVSLDADTSALIDIVGATWFADWTVIAIAHKVDSLVTFDRVAVLDHGRMVEFGEPKKLLARPSAFRDLYEDSRTSERAGAV